MPFFIGIDLGKKQDHTAIAIVERVDVYRPYGGPEFRELQVRWLERVSLGTPYPMVAERIHEITHHPSIAGDCSIAVDGTGVGVPVVDLLRRAGLGCEVMPVTMTGGERAKQAGTGWTVPKMELISGLQVLLEQGQLRVAGRLRQTGALVRELVDIKLRETATKVTAGAEGAGEHDDLAIALALACWRAKLGAKGMVGTRRLTGV